MYIFIIIMVVILIFMLGTYNSFVKLNNRVEEAFSTMDAYLKKRWDLIPNIVEVVKGYVKHERTTLEEIINIRNNIYDDMNNDDKVDANNKLSNGISKVMALAEAYPDLKANENFRDLSNQLAKVEEDIVHARKYYNATVRMFNDKVEMFPSNIIAMIFKYKTKDMFEINDQERENVKINLKKVVYFMKLINKLFLFIVLLILLNVPNKVFAKYDYILNSYDINIIIFKFKLIEEITLVSI